MSSKRKPFALLDKNEDKTADNYIKYSSLLKPIFENVNYYISKKNPYYKEIFNETKKFQQDIERDYELNADKYYPILSKSIEIENYKLGKNLFPNLKLLIENDFLIGTTPLDELDINFPLPNELSSLTSSYSDNNEGKRVIDLMVYSLSEVDNIFRDVDIWYLVVECMDQIIKNPKTNISIKNESFKRIYLFFFRIYNKFDNENAKQKIIKDCLYYLINNSLDYLFSYFNSASPLLPIEKKVDNFASISDKVSSYSDSINTGISLMRVYDKLGTSECIENVKMKNYNPIDLFVCRIVKSIVDTICFRLSEDETSKKSIIPLIPKKESDFNKPYFKILCSPKIYNEYAYQSGFFGWCYICRKTANLYCIDNRVSLCSFPCKQILALEEQQLRELKSHLVRDCPKMFKYFCQILTNKANPIKQKIMSLEIISNILEKYGKCLCQERGFIKVVKENLIEGLFKSCLSTEVNILTLAIRVFFEVWKLFRENLKREIHFFNENVLLKILSSTNSSFKQKKIVLENFSKRDFIYFMELYANYDCDLGEKSTVNSIAVSFSDIVKGRYSRSSQNFSGNENYELVNLALKTLSSMLQSIFEICLEVYQINKNNHNPDENKTYSIEAAQLDDSYNVTISSSDYTILAERNEKIKKKNEYKKAAYKFNSKIKNGIKYLSDNNLIDCKTLDMEAKGIVEFFRNAPSLQKNCIGEFLGENTELSIKTLKYYVNSFDFKDMHIIQALRIFLSTFQLPAEGQKIDRVLESFSTKYFNDNKNMFTNSDCVFYLSYAIMILQTELHNPNVKEKMSLESFIKILEEQNKGELSQEYLTDIYKQIQEEPLSLNELEEEKEKLNKDKAEEKYAREKQRILKEYDFNRKMVKSKEAPYFKLKDDKIKEYLPQFMISIWESLLPMYSVIIEGSDEPSLYEQGIKDMSNGIKIFGLMGTNKEKQNIIYFFCEMTNLIPERPLKKKNVLCLKELLHLANKDYRYSKGSWNLILEIVNKLCYYIIFNSLPKEEKEKIFENERQNLNIKNPSLADESIEIKKDITKILTKEFTADEYEKIFPKTLNFDIETLAEFITSICDIAKKQFKEGGLTGIFFLQSIVEVAEINLLYRSRFERSDIWETLFDFFIDVGISPDIEKSNTSIDCLRQLAIKYLEKNENKDSRLQTMFFDSFLSIWKKCSNESTQEYIIFCINSLVNNNILKIKSGWFVVIKIFQELVEINKFTNLHMKVLSTLEKISKSSFKELNEIFNMLIECLKLYIYKYPEKTLEIVQNLTPKIDNQDNYKSLLSCYPLFITHYNEKIRNQSLSDFNDCLFKRFKQPKAPSYILESVKNEKFWKYALIEISFPMIESLAQKTSNFYTGGGGNSNNNSNLINTMTNNNSTAATYNNITENITEGGWSNIEKEKEKYSGTLESLLIKIGNIFNEFFMYNHAQLPLFFQTLEKIIFSGDEKVQGSGLECVKFLYSSDKMKNKEFQQKFILFLTSLADKSLEKDLLKIEEKDLLDNKKQSQYNEIIDINILYSFTHLNIISLIDTLIQQYVNEINVEDLNKILDCLESSFILSNQFNAKIELRLLISNFLKANNTINLYNQFQISIKNFYKLLEYLYCDNNLLSSRQIYFKRIIDSSINFLVEYVDRIKEFKDFCDRLKNTDNKNNENELKEREIFLFNYVTPVCNYVFPIIQKIEFYKIEKYRDLVTKLLLELILCYDQRVRNKVKDLLTMIYFKLIKD